MPTEPKCDVCGTFCGLWLTGDGWRCPSCMWAEVVELRAEVKALVSGAKDRLARCGDAAVKALCLDHDHDSPDDVQAGIERLQAVISGIQGGERPGDTLIRLAPLIRSVKRTSDQPDTTTADWREWLLDFGARLNEVSGEKKRWDFKKSVQRANGSG